VLDLNISYSDMYKPHYCIGNIIHYLGLLLRNYQMKITSFHFHISKGHSQAYKIYELTWFLDYSWLVSTANLYFHRVYIKRVSVLSEDSFLDDTISKDLQLNCSKTYGISHDNLCSEGKGCIVRDEHLDNLHMKSLKRLLDSS